VSLYARAKGFSMRMSSSWRWLLDMTYPVVSWFSGLGFNRNIWKVFGDSQIEDLWIDFFCVTTNISHYRMEVHRRGYLWRFVRASMSLSGFLPPLCDQGSMLVDGGYLNNLPVDVMQSQGADIIIAINVARDDDTVAINYPDYVSGWWILFKKLFFLRNEIPPLEEIQSRLTYAWCMRSLEEVYRLKGCLHMKPPVQSYGLMEFNKFNDIVEAGYAYGKECIAKWEKSGVISLLKPETMGERSGRAGSTRIRRNSI
jgi:lysophospholipid hydrolase